MVVLGRSFSIVKRAHFPSFACVSALRCVNGSNLCLDSDRCGGPSFSRGGLEFQHFGLMRCGGG